jgi:arabinofuranosyltransferase
LRDTEITRAAHHGGEAVEDGIVDERNYYYVRGRGLINRNRQGFPRFAEEVATEENYTQIIQTCGNLGRLGLSSGPSGYLLDTCALADPLLSRLPMRSRADWRIGHFVRDVPAGYEQSLIQNANLIKDRKLRAFYGHIRKITRGEIWDTDRIKTIVLMNLGHYDYLVSGDSKAAQHATGAE